METPARLLVPAFVFLSLVFGSQPAQASTHYSQYGQSRTNQVSLTASSSETFEVNGIAMNRETRWSVNEGSGYVLKETDQSGLLAIDPDYTYTITKNTSIKAAVYNSDGTVKETHVWEVTLAYALSVSTTGTGSGIVKTTPAGIYCPSSCNASYYAGTQITLTAEASSGSQFGAWSGACSGVTGTSCTVTMNAAKSVGASFTKITHSLSVSTTGSGSVKSNVTGISCPTDCSETYDWGTPVTLTATASSGWTFAGWTGACTGTGTCSLTMNANKSVAATFTQNRTVTVALAGAGTGSVASTPGGINCPTTCSAAYVQDSPVTLTATAGAASFFSGWSGACSGTSTCNLTMTADKSVTATFAIKAPTGVTASDRTYSDKVLVSWTAVAGASSYEIWRGTSSSSANASRIKSGVTTTSYDDTAATAETTYYYWVKTVYGGSSSDFSSSDTGVRKTPPPANDNFSAASSVGALGGTSHTNNTGATRETNEPAHAGIMGGASLWWTWTPQATGTAIIDTIGSGFDTLLAVYTGTSVTALTAKASDNDSGGSGTSTVTFAAVSGTTYRIAVDGRNGATGDLWLHVTAPTPPPAPENVVASDEAFADKVRITWSAVTGATSYEVWRSNVDLASASTLLKSDVTGTSYDDATAVPGTGYFYFVKTVKGTETSPHSQSDRGVRLAAAAIEVILYRVSNTSGTSHSANPGTAQTQFTVGTTVRVTLAARNTGNVGENLNWTLALAPTTNHADRRFDSDPSPNATNDKTVPTDGQWHYVSFDWAIPASAPTGSYDALGVLRRAATWADILDDTQLGPQTWGLGDPAWQAAFAVGTVPKCYAPRTTYFPTALVPVESAGDQSFLVPLSASSDDALERLLAQPGTGERRNLWNASVRRDRYTVSLIQMATLSNFRPAQVAAFLRTYLDAAPEPIRTTQAYVTLANYFAAIEAGHVTANNTIGELRQDPRILSINAVRELIGLLLELGKLADTIEPGVTLADARLKLFPQPGQAYTPTMWPKVKAWTKSLERAAERIEAGLAVASIGATVYDVAVTSILAGVMANDAARARLDSIEAALQTNAQLWSDPALRAAVADAKGTLAQSTVPLIVDSAITGLLENLPGLAADTYTVAKAVTGKTATAALVKALATKGITLTTAQAGRLGIGLWALAEEFKIFLEINEQLEHLEIAVTSATTAATVCSQSSQTADLRVPAMYGFVDSAAAVEDAFTFENPLIWLVGVLTGQGYSETAQMWRSAADEFNAGLLEEWQATSATPPCAYALTPAEHTVSGLAGSGNFRVTTTIGCDWSAVPAATWLHTTSTGRGSGTVYYTFDAGGSEPRTGTIGVGNQSFRVSQGGQITAPGAPTDVSGVPGDGQVTVRWTAPDDTGGSPITGYTATANPGGRTCTATGALSCVVTNLTNGTAYTFTVVAANVVGPGAASAPSTPVTPNPMPTVPGAPTGVTAEADDGQVTVNWTAPASDGGSPITGYTATANPGGRTCTTTGALACVVTNLTNGTAYTFTVVAANVVGPGAASAPSNSVTPVGPGLPASIQARLEAALFVAKVDFPPTTSWATDTIRGHASYADGTVDAGYLVLTRQFSDFSLPPDTNNDIPAVPEGIGLTYVVSPDRTIYVAATGPMPQALMTLFGYPSRVGWPLSHPAIGLSETDTETLRSAGLPSYDSLGPKFLTLPQVAMVLYKDWVSKSLVSNPLSNVDIFATTTVEVRNNTAQAIVMGYGRVGTNCLKAGLNPNPMIDRWWPKGSADACGTASGGFGLSVTNPGGHWFTWNGAFNDNGTTASVLWDGVAKAHHVNWGGDTFVSVSPTALPQAVELSHTSVWSGNSAEFAVVAQADALQLTSPWETPQVGSVVQPVTFTLGPSGQVVLGPFNKISPPNSPILLETGGSRTLTFAWSPSVGATSYEVCIDGSSNDACNSQWVNVGNITQFTVSVTGGTTCPNAGGSDLPGILPIPPTDGRCYWQARSRNGTEFLEADGGTWWAVGVAPPPPPDVRSISPASGRVGSGGTLVTITGTGFAAGATARVGDQVLASPQVVNATSITGLVACQAPGQFDVVVANPDGQQDSLPAAFRCLDNTPVPTDHLVAYYPLDGSGANVAGPGHQGALRNTPTAVADRFGRDGRALRFAQTNNQWIEVADRWFESGTAPFSLSAWVLVDDLDAGGGTAVASMDDRGTYLWYLPADRSFAGSIREAGSSSYPMVKVPVTAPGWYHVTATWQGAADGRYDLYVNGAPAATATWARTLNENGYNSGIAGNSYHNGVFTGAIDDVRVYTRALTAAEVQALYLVTAGPAPTLTAVTPSTAGGAGGVTVTLTGTGFVTGPTVTFGGASATNVVVVNETTITATTPAHAAGVVDVVVTNPDGQSATRAGAFTYGDAPPTVGYWRFDEVTGTTVADSSGYGNHGTAPNNAIAAGVCGNGRVIPQVGGVGGIEIPNSPSLDISGTGAGSAFTLEAFVYAPRHEISGLSMVYKLGQYGLLAGSFGSRGMVYMVVGSAEGDQALTPGVPLPTGRWVHVAATWDGTTARLYIDRGLAGSQVFTGAIPSSTAPLWLARTGNQPPDSQTTFDEVRITRAALTPEQFLTGCAVAPPTVTAVSPTSGPTTGNTAVTITGTGFVTGATATFGGASATNVMVVNATTITATTPAHVAGAVDVVVTNPDAQSGTLVGRFTYTGTASVSGTVFYSTTPLPGIEIQLTQGAYSNPPLRTTTSDQSGRYQFLDLVDGTYWVKRVAPAGYSTGGTTVNVSGAVTHDVYIPKHITLLTPANQATVSSPHPTLTWQPITEAVRYKVQINDTLQWSPTFEWQDSLTANYTVQGTLTPNRSYTWQIDAVDAAGHSVGTTANSFQMTYTPPAIEITGITPTTGPVSGGTVVTISGSGFQSGDTVTVGGVAATVSSSTTTTIVATVGPHAAGLVDVVISRTGVVSATLPGAFTYVDSSPELTGMSPAQGAIGDRVTLTGTGLTGATAVTFHGVPAAFTVDGATQITTAVPAGAITGRVRVTTPGGNATSALDFVVTNQRAVRRLPACYAPGFPLTVTLDVGPAPTVLAHAVEEAPPETWTRGPISNGGTWETVARAIKWGPFFETTALQLTYDITPPSDARDPVTFAGVASFDGVDVPIGGATTLPRCEGHPADTNEDFRITIEELTAYAATWRRGLPWPVPPSPIEIGYVTRAGYLWRSGESYRRDEAPPCPACWVPLPAARPSAALFGVSPPPVLVRDWRPTRSGSPGLRRP